MLGPSGPCGAGGGVCGAPARGEPAGDRGASRTAGEHDLAGASAGTGAGAGLLSSAGPGCVLAAPVAMRAPAEAGVRRGVLALRLSTGVSATLVTRTDRGDTGARAVRCATARISDETNCAAIYAQPRVGLKAAMSLALRHGKPRPGTVAVSAIVLESSKIIHRPEALAARLFPGHGEWVRTVAPVGPRKPATQDWPGVRRSASGSAIPMPHGSAARPRTPTGFCISSCPRGRTSRPIPSATSTASRSSRTTGAARPAAEGHRPKPSPGKTPEALRLEIELTDRKRPQTSH